MGQLWSAVGAHEQKCQKLEIKTKEKLAKKRKKFSHIPPVFFRVCYNKDDMNQQSPETFDREDDNYENPV